MSVLLIGVGLWFVKQCIFVSWTWEYSSYFPVFETGPKGGWNISNKVSDIFFSVTTCLTFSFPMKLSSLYLVFISINFLYYRISKNKKKKILWFKKKKKKKKKSRKIRFSRLTTNHNLRNLDNLFKWLFFYHVQANFWTILIKQPNFTNYRISSNTSVQINYFYLI